MQNHTPGPWVVSHGCNVLAPKEHRPLTRLSYIAVTGGLSGEDTIERDEANAHLIAAAPELLAALESAPIPARGEEMMEFRGRQDKWLRDIYVPAIAKAKGGAA